MKGHIYPEMGIDPANVQEVTKVRAGKAGSGKRAMPPALKARLLGKWDAIMAGPTGCKTYANFVAKVKAERAY